MKKILVLSLVAASVLAVNASAAFTAPDFSSAITDMGVAFGAVMTLLVAGLGFAFIKRMLGK